MRLLVVMTHYPCPPRTGSAILAYRNIKELAQRHEIHLICADDAKDRGDLGELVKQMEFAGRKKRPLFIKLLRYAFYMLQGFPAWMITSMSHEMRRRVGELIDQRNFDAILLYEITAIQYCPQSSHKKMIVNIEDPPSIKLRRLRELEVWSLWQKLNLYLLEKSTARYEKSFFPEIAKILVLSESDLKDLRKQEALSNTGCVSYGVDPRPSSEILAYDARTRGMIVFSGNMHHPPNIDAALSFLQHTFPLVLREYPTATLWIVGANPDERVREAAKIFMEHVVLTGWVEDMSVYLQRATVCICPVNLKIGVQTKILESLSWGTPVVTTSAGNSGIQAFSGTQLWVEDKSEKFAQRVVSLLRGENWHLFSEEGRKLIIDKFSWKRSADELERHLESIKMAA